MRARIDAILRRGLRSMVAPPALSMGLALATGCKAHVPERSPCTVYDFDDEAENAPCLVSRPEGVLIYAATPPPGDAPAPPYYGPDEGIAPPSDGPDGTPGTRAPLGPAPTLFKPRPESAAREIAAAIEGCDLPTLRAAILSYDELSAISRTPPDATAYEELVTRWFAKWSLTECTPRHTTTAPRQPTIKSAVNVPAGAEWKSPLAIVSVTLPLQTSPEQPSQISMVDLDGRWRILLR
jgi:hypothetical protein